MKLWMTLSQPTPAIETDESQIQNDFVITQQQLLHQRKEKKDFDLISTIR